MCQNECTAESVSNEIRLDVSQEVLLLTQEVLDSTSECDPEAALVNINHIKWVSR